MNIGKGLKRGLASLLGSVAAGAEEKPSGPQKKYMLRLSIPIKAPNKRLVEDQCKMAGHKVSEHAETLITVAGIDPRIEVDGEVQLEVKSRK